MATALSHHHQHQFHQNTSGGHFCKDCGVMFESSTSLEVHLSYHKENLLSKWATQESLEKSHNPIPQSSSPLSYTHQRPSSANNSLSPKSDSQTSYYSCPGSEPQFLPQYNNNNTGDNTGMEPPSAHDSYRYNSFGQPPVDTGVPLSSHSYGQHTAPLAYPSPHGGLFSSNAPEHGPLGGQLNGHAPLQGSGGRDSAEILDLDSHKVHIYLHQQQQQQLASERNGSFFHRPYLPNLIPQPPPHIQSPSNGWTTGVPSPSGNQIYISTAGTPVHIRMTEPQLPGGTPSTVSNTLYSPAPAPPNPIVYDVPRPEAGSGVLHYGDSHLLSSAPSNNSNNFTSIHSPPPHGQYIGNSGPGNPQNSSYGAPSQLQQPVVKANVSNMNSPVTSNNSQRSPTVKSNGNGSNKSQSTPDSAVVKTKGWRGGECKRPKTYNCTACNKWFTSSGHLKRHYGTTLHKNSIKQRGDIPEEPPKPAKRGKYANSQQRKSTDPGQDKSLPLPTPSPRSNTDSNVPIKSEPPEELRDSAMGYGTQTAPVVEGMGHSISGSHIGNGNGGLGADAYGRMVGAPPPPEVTNNAPLSHIPSPHYNPSYSPYNGGRIVLGKQSNSPPQQAQYGGGGNMVGQVGGVGNQFLGMPQAAHPFSSGGYSGEGIQTGGHFTLPSSMPPRGNYNYVAPSESGGGGNGSLPPFSAVGGFSHYDASGSNGNMGGMSSSSPGSSSTMPPHPSPSRVSSPYGRVSREPSPATIKMTNSRNNNNNNVGGSNGSVSMGGGALISNGSDGMGDGCQMDGPEEVRSGSTLGSFDVSVVDGMENSCSINGGSPNSSASRSSVTRNNCGSSAYASSSFDDDDVNKDAEDSRIRDMMISCNTSSDLGVGSINNSSEPCISRDAAVAPVTPTSTGIVSTNNDDNSAKLSNYRSNNHSSKSNNDKGGISRSGSKENEVFKCPDCSKTFGRACYLTQHTNSLHAGGKPFKCPTCGKRFMEAPALSKHVAKHGSDKPHKCDLCPKQFNHKTDLRRHHCLHTGKKPFACSICGKGFIRKDHMTKHCETHKKKGNSSSGGGNNKTLVKGNTTNHTVKKD